MYLIYLDESCDTGPYGAKSDEKKSDKERNRESQTRFYIISALLVPYEEVHSLERIISNIYDYLLSIGLEGGLEEIKGSNLWRRLREKYEKDLIKAKQAMQGIYDVVKNGEYTVIAIAIDKEAYVAELDKELMGTRSSLRKTLNDIKDKTYFNVLSLPSVRNVVDSVVDRKFTDLRDSLASSLTKYQAMNDLILRIAKFLENKDTSAILFFDKDANTLRDSVYAYLTTGFRRNGVATRWGTYPEVSRIKSFHLLDSKLSPPLWIADLIAYGIHMVLEYKDKEVYNKLKDLFDKGPNGATWGYGFKVIPWSEEDFKSHLQI